MALELTDNLDDASKEAVKRPQLLLKIEGIETCYSSASVGRYWRVGDPEVVIPLGGIGLNDLTIGGIVAIDDQETILSLENGTSSRISQQLQAQDGTASVSSMQIAMIDQDLKATELISPGVVVEDILGRAADVYLGFDNTGFPNDYIRVHRGIIDDIESSPGLVVLNIAHPDQLKRQRIFESGESQLNGAIGSGDSSITVDDASKFLDRVNGPDGSKTPDFSTYIRIEDELILFTGISGNTFTGCSRGQLGTVASAHDDGESVTSFYRLQGTVVETALRVLMSGANGFFEEDVQVKNFVQISATESQDDVIFFQNINLAEDYGIFEGMYITITGSGAGNNGTFIIDEVVATDDGSYVSVIGTTFTTEVDSPAVAAFRSQYDVLPDGLNIHPKFVDHARHDFFDRTFLSSFNYDFYLKEAVNGKEFIDKELYVPCGAYSLPRQGKISMGYHSPPIPTASIATVDSETINNPDKLSIRRTLGKNFYNGIVIKYDEGELDDKFFGGFINISATSQSRIPVGNKPRVIESKGLKSGSGAVNQAAIAANRLINRYQFGAEFISNIEAFYQQFSIEAGDIIIFDPTNLYISNTEDGTREKLAALYEVQNRTIDIFNGRVYLSIVNPNFNDQSRYSLISPASFISYTQTLLDRFVIESSYESRFGDNEFRKWRDYVGARVIVRSPDYTTRYDNTRYIAAIVENQIVLDGDLSFTAQAGDIMELAPYSLQDVSNRVILVFGFMQDDPGFPDGENPYNML